MAGIGTDLNSNCGSGEGYSLNLRVPEIYPEQTYGLRAEENLTEQKQPIRRDLCNILRGIRYFVR